MERLIENPFKIDTKDLGNEIREAIEGSAVYMDGKKVGLLLTNRIDQNIKTKEARISRLLGEI